MKTRCRLIRRGVRGGGFYCVDNKTGKRTSLRTGSEDEARQIVEAKNQAERQPVLNLQIAKAYLAGTDNGITTRTWQNAIEALTNTKQGANRERWLRVVKDRALVPLLPRVIIETQGELMLRVLQTGTVSTNVYLRRLHNFCVDMNWLPWPLVPKRQWPVVRFKDKRAIIWEEHCRIVAREQNPERKTFYQLAWHLGASQSDLAHLQAEDVDWQARIICFVRMKTRWRGCTPPQIRFGKEVEEFWPRCRRQGRSFHISPLSVRATGPRNSISVALAWGLTACRCIPTGTRGRSGRRRRAIPNDSRKWRWATIARRCIGHTRRRRR